MPDSLTRSHDSDTASSLPGEVDIAIIGAGPTGLYAAYYAGFRGHSVALIDALPVVGGQVSAMYPDKNIYDVAGFPAVRGRELIAQLQEQAGAFLPTYCLGQSADTLKYEKGPSGDVDSVVIHTSAGNTVRAKAVVVAGGIGGFTPRPMPGQTGLAESDIDHFVTDFARYADKDAVVVGGGDSALDWALALRPVARSVTIVHRRDTFRAHAHSVRQAADMGIRILTNAHLVDSVYEPALSAVQVAIADREHLVVPCHRVVAALGFSAQLGPILDWGFDVESRRHISVGTRMQTTMPRVFAAGDITTYDGKLPLISIGFGEAATAVNNACHVIAPDAPFFGGHSTDASAPKILEGVH